MKGSLSEAAQKSVAAAVKIAGERFGRPVCVAVCDAQGFLAAFHRMDGAFQRSINIAIQKAYTAVVMGSSTTAFGLRLKNEGLAAAAFCDDKLTPIQGGVPVVDGDGKIVAGIAVSGLKPEEDEELALAVMKAVGEWL